MRELNGTGIDQLQQPLFGFVSSRCFSGTLWVADLRRVDICEPDLDAAVENCVSIDHAVLLDAVSAQTKLRATNGPTGGAQFAYHVSGHYAAYH